MNWQRHLEEGKKALKIFFSLKRGKSNSTLSK